MAFYSGESIYDLVKPDIVPIPYVRTSRDEKAQLKAKASAPPSYSTLGLKNSTKLVANVSGQEVDIDAYAGGVHAVKASNRSIGRQVKPEVDPVDFLRRGTGNPASDSYDSVLRRTMGGASEYYGGPEGEEDGEGGSPQSLPPLGGSGTFRRSLVKERRPAVPGAGEVPIYGLVTDKDFVSANALEISGMPARGVRPPVQRAVDRPTFGKVPVYLERRKAELEEERAIIAASGNASGGQHGRPSGRNGDVELSQEQREELLEKLRSKWAEKIRSYQQLSFRTDTQTKVLRKEQLERELEQIEALISKLSKEHVLVR